VSAVILTVDLLKGGLPLSGGEKPQQKEEPEPWKRSNEWSRYVWQHLLMRILLSHLLLQQREGELGKTPSWPPSSVFRVPDPLL
jgi:hypothetical protein